MNYRLTHPQNRIWYIEKINNNSALHNIGGCLNIHEKINVELMKKAINILLQNNEALRLRIVEKNNEVYQYAEEYKYEEIDYFDFSNCKDSIKEYNDWSNEVFRKCFKLENSKLYYFAIYKMSNNEFGILANIHHIISDGWSISLIQKRICGFYSKLVNNQEYLPTNISYLDYIGDEDAYLNSDRFEKNKKFWLEKFSDLPEEFLYNTSITLEGNRQEYVIQEDLSKQIKAYIKDQKCSLNTFFISSLLIYINKITGKDDIVIGTPVFNRSNKKQKDMIGMFTSTVPFRFELDKEVNFNELIKLVNKELRVYLLNQKYPYDLLIKDLGIGKEGYDSLFKMCVNYYNTNYDNHIDDIDVDVKEYYSGNQSYSLQLTVKEWEEDKITLNFDYKTQEYSNVQIKEMYKAIINIAKQVVENEDIPIRELTLLRKEESNYKIYDLNSTASEYPRKTVFELFEEIVSKQPNKIAVKCKDTYLTYRELNERANELANYLREKGIGRGSIVGVMETHSIELMISILGVIKAGAAYLPIDPTYPSDRINYMLEDSQSSMLLTNLDNLEDVKFIKEIININNKDFSVYSKDNLSNISGLNDLVYIIYTSGSTGKPKGVMIEHQGLTNYICWASKTYLTEEDETMALYSSISFDLTVTTTFAPLISGNRIVIYENDESEFVLYKILRENEATVVKLTPAHLTLLKDLDNTSSNIRRFIVGGEDLKVNLAKEVSNSFGNKIEICNEYGPTEAVVGCMIYKYNVDKDTGVSVPIGYPADNVQIYILDNELKPVPTETIGELYISGDGVARGYLNREDLTKERFITNPYIQGKRMYKTGDTARYLENGVIEYSGRVDNQVKIRGHRIEIGEIEKYLLENSCVKDAVVICKEDSSNSKFLNAYLVLNEEITSSELKKWLLEFLPKYMIPNNFIFMDKLPLTLNGKVNYALLPEAEKVETEFAQYNTKPEEVLVKTMEDILCVKNISMNDNYYQLGGDSIKAIQIASKLKNEGYNIKVKDILAYDSISEIAATIEENAESKVISQERSEGSIIKTPIMEWFFENKLYNESFYNQFISLEFKESLDIEKVNIALNKLIEHHDALRFNYNKSSKEMYYNNNLNGNCKVIEYDLSKYSGNVLSEKVEEKLQEVNSSLSLNEGSLFKIVLINLSSNKQVIVFVAHHLLVDGVSWRIILDDFMTILNQLNNKEDIRLPLKTNSYKEWAEALQNYSNKNFDTEESYWKTVVGKDTAIESDFSKDIDTVESSVTLTKEIDEETLTNIINKVNEIYNLDLNEILIIALVITLNKLTEKDEVILELERHGREIIDENIDISRTVGWFTSIFLAYFNIEHDDLEGNIKSLKEQLRNIPNKGFDYSVIKYLKKELNTSVSKNVRFNYLGDFGNIIDREKFNITDIKFGLRSHKENTLTSLIDINAIVDGKLIIDFEYSKNKFKDETIERLADSYKETLIEILNKCLNKDSKEFTPSDFDIDDISQDDLDMLFE